MWRFAAHEYSDDLQLIYESYSYLRALKHGALIDSYLDLWLAIDRFAAHRVRAVGAFNIGRTNRRNEEKVEV